MRFPSHCHQGTEEGNPANPNPSSPEACECGSFPIPQARNLFYVHFEVCENISLAKEVITYSEPFSHMKLSLIVIHIQQVGKSAFLFSPELSPAVSKAPYTELSPQYGVVLDVSDPLSASVSTKYVCFCRGSGKHVSHLLCIVPFFNLWVMITGKHIFLMLLGAKKPLESNITVRKKQQK